MSNKGYDLCRQFLMRARWSFVCVFVELEHCTLLSGCPWSGAASVKTITIPIFIRGQWDWQFLVPKAVQ